MISKLFFHFVLIVSLSSIIISNEIDSNLNAIIDTEKGKIKVKLYGKEAPLTVGNFVNLSKRGFYDGLKFHRIEKNFMIQVGCPMNIGVGGPGYKFEDETRAYLKHSGPGILSMANSGPNTNGSQFFITHVQTGWLDGKHTVFGKVIEGQEVVNKINKGDKINSITITGDIPKEMKEIQPRIDEFNKILDKNYPNLKPAENF